jgi:hypothetical protein
MPIGEILAQIEFQIAQLKHAHAVLSGGAAPASKKAVGRPKKAAPASKKEATVARTATKLEKKKKKRNISPEGRKRIADAAKKRWAAQKAASGK